MALGRPKTKIDEDVLAGLLEKDWTKTDIADEFGIDRRTLSSRIADLQKKEGVILQYRALQSLELTEIEAKILEAINPEKIQEASLRDLVTAYKILKDKELVSEGRPNEIKGLVGYLMHLEKEDTSVKVSQAEAIEAELVTKDPEAVQKEMDRDLDSFEEDEDDTDQYTAERSGDTPSVKNDPMFPFEDLPDL